VSIPLVVMDIDFQIVQLLTWLRVPCDAMLDLLGSQDGCVAETVDTAGISLKDMSCHHYQTV
jgi:hypothetical protein